MNHTFGYVLCCQSPALFLLAIALVIRFFVRRGKAKFRAVLSLVAGLVCVALGVVLYYQGMLREYFAVRNFWHIRTPGWIGLALVALLLLYLGIQSFLRASARRAEEKEAIRAENQRQLAMEQGGCDVLLRVRGGPGSPRPGGAGRPGTRRPGTRHPGTRRSGTRRSGTRRSGTRRSGRGAAGPDAAALREEKCAPAQGEVLIRQLTATIG